MYLIKPLIHRGGKRLFIFVFFYFQTAVMDQMSMKEKLNVSTIASNELFWIIHVIVVLVLFMFFLKE